MDNMDLLGNVFVDTIDTIRCRIFLEFSNLSNQNVILFGPRGSGKTKLIQEFIDDFGNYTVLRSLANSCLNFKLQLELLLLLFERHYKLRLATD